LLLPCALVFQLRAKPRWPALLVPACIAVLLIGWIAVYLLSNSNYLPPQALLETSYSRLIMIPTFSAILYCADALLDWSGAQVKTEFGAGPTRLDDQAFPASTANAKSSRGGVCTPLQMAD
jgi:hypothetical protein